MTFLSEDTADMEQPAPDSEQPARGTGHAAGKHNHGDVTQVLAAPAVIVALMREHFGPEADFIPEIPLWFAGNHTAKECEEMMLDKVKILPTPRHTGTPPPPPPPPRWHAGCKLGVMPQRQSMRSMSHPRTLMLC